MTGVELMAGSTCAGDELELAVVDFRGLDPSNPTATGERWQSARAQVVAALEAHGCFEAIFDRAGTELREELFGRAMPELLSLPLEAKLKNTPDGPLFGYIGQIPGMAYESLRVSAAATLEGSQTFTNLMWPEGNPTFCNTIWSFAKHMQELAQMVHRMVLQSFDIEKYYDCHIGTGASALRLSEYGNPLNQEIKTGMAPHKDPNIFTIICQQREGLQVETRTGEWIRVVPLPNSFTFMIGEAFTAWTNGRFRAPYHCVKVPGNVKRYSALFGTRPSDDMMVQPLEELVDSDHPMLFKPFGYKDYVKFRFSEEGRKCKNQLEAYCGVQKEVKV